MKISGAQIVVETLIEQGVEMVFGYPGGAVIDIFDALHKSRDRLNYTVSCHEQGAAHAADGYARATGKTGVVVATSGPGATNLVTGIATAFLDSTPLVAITGNVAQSLMGKDSFQEVDIRGITMPITKHNYLVQDMSKLADIIREAFAIANSGRPGPVLIDIPKDIQIGEAKFVPGEPNGSKYKTKVKEAELMRALELINEAERPIIYAGGGIVASDATAELLQFADLIDAPIGSSMMGLSAIPHDHPKRLGMTGMHGKLAASKAMSLSDLVIAIGTRFSDRATGNKKEFVKGRRFLHIDIDPAEIGKNIPAYVSLVGDVKQVLTMLNEKLEKTSREEWHNQIEEVKDHPDSRLEMDNKRLNPQMIIEAVRDFMADDDVVATDVGQHQMWVSQYYKFSSPRTLLTSGGLGTMGFGMGAAIGAAIGSEKRTVLFTGDGSFHMNMNELATAVSSELPIVIVIMNNDSLGMVRQWQTLFYDKRYAGTSLGRKTDFVKFAQALGATGYRVEDKGDLNETLEKAFQTQGPVVVEALIYNDEKVLPMIPPGQSIKEVIIKG